MSYRLFRLTSRIRQCIVLPEQTKTRIIRTLIWNELTYKSDAFRGILVVKKTLEELRDGHPLRSKPSRAACAAPAATHHRGAAGSRTPVRVTTPVNCWELRLVGQLASFSYYLPERVVPLAGFGRLLWSMLHARARGLGVCY